MKTKCVACCMLMVCFSCQQKEKQKVLESKSYIQKDTAFVSKHLKFDRETFNHIVNGFPYLYQYPPLHPDSAFAIKNYAEYKDKDGIEQCIDFRKTPYSAEFYSLYAYFLSQKDRTDEPQRKQLQENFEALSEIYRLITPLSQMQSNVEVKIPALVQYSLYLWQKHKTNEYEGFEQRKTAYLNYLDELKNQIVDVDFRDFREKTFNRYMYSLNLETDFDIEQCKTFEKQYGKR